MGSRTSRIMQAVLCSDRNKQIKEVENSCLEEINLKKKPEEYLLSSRYKKNTGPNAANPNNSDSDMRNDLVGSEFLCSDQNNGINEIENNCREEISFQEKQVDSSSSFSHSSKKDIDPVSNATNSDSDETKYLVKSEHVKENEEGCLPFENLQNVIDFDVVEQNIELFHTNTQQNITSHTKDLNSRCFDLEDCNSDDSIKDPNYDSDSSSSSSSSSSTNSSSLNSSSSSSSSSSSTRSARSPRCTDSVANSTSKHRLNLVEVSSTLVTESESNIGQSKDAEEKKARKRIPKETEWIKLKTKMLRNMAIDYGPQVVITCTGQNFERYS
ncbi:unnamed protein product [Diabrotica balteata]|uniref:Uncharacterized protein n=1 Tax=Diabrotica balteata TaxID=107213 RepID=A0A9N9T2P8_DIABA|nr:unnamed protein product [Diabrotica balteata]